MQVFAFVFLMICILIVHECCVYVYSFFFEKTLEAVYIKINQHLDFALMSMFIVLERIVP